MLKIRTTSNGHPILGQQRESIAQQKPSTVTLPFNSHSSKGPVRKLAVGN